MGTTRGQQAASAADRLVAARRRGDTAAEKAARAVLVAVCRVAGGDPEALTADAERRAGAAPAWRGATGGGAGGVVRVAAISDLHGVLPAPEACECDVLVIAGDVCPLHSHAAWEQRRWLQRTLAPWLECVPAKHAVCAVAGNHDLIFARSEPPFVPVLPCDYLQDDGVELSGLGLAIWGTPWISFIGEAWAFQAPRDDSGELFLRERFALIPEGIDILVSHSPPSGFGDLTVFGDRAGSLALLDAIRRVRPALVVCGHIHEARGLYSVHAGSKRSVPVANVSAVDAHYTPTHAPMRFELAPGGSARRVSDWSGGTGAAP